MSAISQKYQSNSWLGKPQNVESVCPDGVGHYQHFEKGSIYWTPTTGAHLIYGYIRDKWASMGWERSPLGYPVSDEADVTSKKGRYNNFQGGAIFFKSGTTQAFAVYGSIYAKWGETNYDMGFLGFPQTDEMGTPDGIGRYNHFEGGSIYWTPDTGAHLIYGYIRNKWASMGWERSPLGYPVSDEADAGSKKGRYNNFQYGTIIWRSGASEAFAVYGSIYAKWGEKGYDMGSLGFPQTDEMGTPDGIGRFNHFEGGSIYWTPDTGAHSVQGAIRDAWASQGWEVSRLQYPVTDELVTDGTNGLGRHSNFEGGEIYWTPTGGTKINLYPVKSTLITCNDLHAGNVTASEIRVELFTDGQWKFHSHLHDSSDFYGDGFGIGFVFNGDGHGAAFSGTLGAAASGPARNYDGNIGGSDPWIEKFWHKASRAGLHFKLHVKGDPLSALGTVKKALSDYGPTLIMLAGSL